MNVISFDKLNLSFDISPVAFYVGAKEVYWYALMIMAGFLLAVGFCAWSGKKRGINPEHIIDIAIYGLISGIICGRIYYVIFDFEAYRHNFMDVFKIWEGGLAIYGAIIGAIISTFIYCKIKKLCVYEMFDITSPGLLIGQAVGRYGNFFNMEVFGKTTDSLFGMSINGAEPVHPLFFYESMWNILGLIIILIFRDKKKAHGQVFYFYILWYSLGRIVLEGLRNPEYILMVPGTSIAISQLVAGVFIVLALVMLLKNRKSQTNEDRNA